MSFRTLTCQVTAHTWNRVQDLKERAAGENGYTTEAVIAIVALAALALTVTGLLTREVVAKARSLNLGG